MWCLLALLKGMRAVLPPSIGRAAGNGGRRIVFSSEALQHLPRVLATGKDYGIAGEMSYI